MTLAAVSDAGPLIHLAEIDSLDLLSVIDPLVVPETVHGEVERGGAPDGLSALQFDVVSADCDLDTGTDLDAGERAALCIARDRDAILLTDDLAARKRATADGLEVHGSVGVIALGCGRGVVGRDGAAARMRALQRETSLFLTDAVVERGIRLLDEE